MTGANQQCTNTICFEGNIHSILTSHELELYEMTKLCDITIEPQVFKVLLQLLQMDVSPAAVFTMLLNMSAHIAKPVVNTKKSMHVKSGSNPSSITKKPPIAAKPKKGTRSESH